MGVYDLAAEKLRSLVWVFDATFRYAPPNDKEARPYSGVVEWRSSPTDLVLFDFEKEADLKA